MNYKRDFNFSFLMLYMILFLFYIKVFYIVILLLFLSLSCKMIDKVYSSYVLMNMVMFLMKLGWFVWIFFFVIMLSLLLNMME